ncbi:GAF domain-containing sensor histidine kinase [Deinococcus altitudinis]|uniref:GAF domain-containing sensor histidine kinase n=1 Tax=Deinococcus altitudinis TaxID=468914 RepID=UPI003891DF8D
MWPLLLVAGSLWILQRQVHAHWLDLTWTVRDLTDVQWSPDATHARLWLDAAGLPLAALAASLCLQVGRAGWRLPLAAAFAGLGIIGSDLVPGFSVWMSLPLLLLGVALVSGVLERPSATSRLLLWGQGAALFCGVLWWAERLPDLTQAPSLLGSASLGLLWYGLATPGLRDLGPLVFSLCALIVLLGQTPGTLRGGVMRVLVFAGLSLGTALVFTLVVGGASVLLGVRSSFYPSIAAAALVAAGLDPARILLSRSVRQLLYGERDDPSAVMQRVAQHLGGGSDAGPWPGSRLGAAPGVQLGMPSGRETIEAGAREAALALRLPSLHLELLRGDRLGYSEVPTTVQSASQAIEQEVGTLVAGGERLGVLTAAPRSVRETFTPGELRLLEGLARQFAGAVHAWQLAEDLQTSQIGAVRAGEEERRRLRRDLHDGLGPSLSGLGLKIEAASVALVHSPRQAADTLDSLKRDVRECVAEVRRLVHDLRPPKLDDLGLIGALEELLRGAELAGLDARLEVQEPLPPLGAAVEVAVYRIAQEAVTNVLRHAHASRVLLRLQHDQDTLTLECLDNGVGLPEVREPGVGSRSMRERAGALSGQLELTSRAASGGFTTGPTLPTPSPKLAPGDTDQGGTRVCARLPLGSPAFLRGSGE